MSQEKTLWSLEALSQVLQQTDLPFVSEGRACALDRQKQEVQLYLVPLQGRPLILSLSGTQILTSVLLWPRLQKMDAEGFEARMLRSHKTLFPLAALSISDYQGAEWYELFGSMSCESDLSAIVTEIKMMVENALQLMAQEAQTLKTNEIVEC